MTPIRRFDTADAAYIAKGLLDSYGIQAEVVSNAASSIFPAPTAGIGVSTLYVPEADAARATSLLASHGD